MRRPLFPLCFLLALLTSQACKRHDVPNVIVLGIDGMDPNFVERHWQSLPNLTALRTQGSFQRLATTTPPQSPVAWSTFITALDPADHEIFDFVHRDAKTLQPFSSMSSTEGATRSLPLGPYLLPLTRARVTSLRQGAPFWDALAQGGIPVDVLKMPTNYPPDENGRALAGMGTPDLTGTLGTFSFFTDDPLETSRSVPGGRIVKVQLNLGRAAISLEGPRNTLRRDASATSIPIAIDVDPQNPVARLKVANQALILRQGEWSDWIPVEFDLIPHVSSVKGMVRFFARQWQPGFELYVSPVNIDPMAPALPVSAPAGWARQVARTTGRYYTQGIPEDTSALRQGVLSLEEFETQTRLVFEEERRLLRYSLAHYHGGFLFVYFSSIDQSSHILWARHEAELLRVYQEVDSVIGEVRKSTPDAELIVMSDHGFTTYDRSVHLNTWLNRQGLLSQKADSDRTTMSSIDWPRTEAYALGLNGLYLNRKGRESQGIVPSGERSAALIASLRQRLLEWRDPLNGNPIILSVVETKQTPHNAGVRPDLIVGYAPGYRASWQTGLGGAGPEELEDNKDAWIGDHCIDAASVPGVLFTKRKINATNPSLKDVTASILSLYGRKLPSNSTAMSFYR